jgi:hypothetical protein
MAFNCWTTLASVTSSSAPVSAVIVEVALMVGCEPRSLSTKLSRTGEYELNGTLLRIRYLNKVGGRGPGPRRRGGAVVAPHWQGRIVQRLKLVTLSMILPRRRPPLFIVPRGGLQSVIRKPISTKETNGYPIACLTNSLILILPYSVDIRFTAGEFLSFLCCLSRHR